MHWIHNILIDYHNLYNINQSGFQVGDWIVLVSSTSQRDHSFIKLDTCSSLMPCMPKYVILSIMHGVECMLKIIPTLAHHLSFSETEILTIGTESERTWLR